jgi:hypothetical protein
MDGRQQLARALVLVAEGVAESSAGGWLVRLVRWPAGGGTLAGLSGG